MSVLKTLVKIKMMTKRKFILKIQTYLNKTLKTLVNIKIFLKKKKLKQNIPILSFINFPT